jgi:hypothetical protein
LKTTIILPSIRVPQNIDAWVAMLHPETDEIIVAGNEASPHEQIIERLDNVSKETGVEMTYLGPDDERVTKTAIYEFIPPNHTTRRNFALLQAITRGTDILVTIDDDNFPLELSWLNGVKALLSGEVNHRMVVRSDTGWWNAGNLCDPKVVHRGFPMSRWTEPDTSKIVTDYPNKRYSKIGVVASLWIGDPDINAVERVVRDPEVMNITGSSTLNTGTWCPFDSQSTAVHGDIMNMMFMWPGVGRYDDIWSSYLMRAVMDVTGWYVTYGRPAVTQERNPHNLIRDIRDELYGYEHTEDFTDLLRDLVSEATTHDLVHAGMYGTSGTTMVFEWFMQQVAKRFTKLPEMTRDSLYAWLTDLERVRRG